MHRSKILKGFFTILWAALIWGIGNSLVGLTAHKYAKSNSFLPAIDIALVAILGGIIFLLLVFIIITRKNGTLKMPGSNEQLSIETNINNPKNIFSGLSKGLNTCLFVLSTSYTSATQSLIFESTYVFWSLIFAILFLGKRTRLIPGVIRIIILLLGVVLVSGQISYTFNGSQNGLGLLFGIMAGISYAIFLLIWSEISGKLEDIQSQLMATLNMLIASAASILLIAEMLSILLYNDIWIPFTNLNINDVILQLINGAFVIGAVYFLITIGLSVLSNAHEEANVVAAIALSFSIPFTLFPELIFGRFKPSTLQIIGIIVFMIGFVLTYIDLNRTWRKDAERSIRNCRKFIR